MRWWFHVLVVGIQVLSLGSCFGVPVIALALYVVDKDRYRGRNR